MSIMIFMFLCFSGLVVMFYYIMRNQEKFYESMRDEHAQMRVMLRVLESQIAVLTGEASDAQPQPQKNAPDEDPLLSLSLNDDRREGPQDNSLELRFDPQDPARR